eukprot:TRINITY_DN2969_c0_g1_i1.p1 TRINITY_DN2969_c0_g1~~TRINITY_DN2969_c0_g1_i1.p1  ORF type:complete len:292 (+),score=115.99 TRINITY_DN2969_c0_g1_i1:244-1119(+)
MSICRAEYNRLSVERKAKVTLLINKVKPKLEKLWDELKTSPEDRMLFYDAAEGNSEEFTEDVYKQIVKEIDRLEKYLESIRPILKMITRREWIKDEMLTFEKSASDPNRLFGSSTQLNKEEQFRKIVATEFPKLTDDLKKKIAAWESDHPSERIIYASRPYLNTMGKETESPDFSLMHLKLLTKPKQEVGDGPLFAISVRSSSSSSSSSSSINNEPSTPKRPSSRGSTTSSSSSTSRPKTPVLESSSSSSSSIPSNHQDEKKEETAPSSSSSSGATEQKDNDYFRKLLSKK